MKSFDIPSFYRSPLISFVKQKRRVADKMKKDFTPTVLDFGSVEILLARHFGFCYGVENAIEIAFKTIKDNPGKTIYLLSEMIHNPQVNSDLQKSGVHFIMDTVGKMYIDWDDLNADDIVIVPAFGTTLEIEQKLRNKGIDPLQYNTTCPFVEKVWNRSAQIGNKGYTIVIHGKPNHEETRATFSHSSVNSPSIVIKDMQEAQLLAQYITHKKPVSDFYKDFAGQYSQDFNPEKDLQKIGVVNQTTMLASDTQAISDFLKLSIKEHLSLSEENLHIHFADTRDTLCYATNDNQSAVLGLLEQTADLAIVVGGYNSSNTSHLVELCEQKLPTFFIENESKLLNKNQILHFDLHHNIELCSEISFTKNSKKTRVLITSGASCPDAVVERVIEKIISFVPNAFSIEKVMGQLN